MREEIREELSRWIRDEIKNVKDEIIFNLKKQLTEQVKESQVRFFCTLRSLLLLRVMILFFNNYDNNDNNNKNIILLIIATVGGSNRFNAQGLETTQE